MLHLYCYNLTYRQLPSCVHPTTPYLIFRVLSCHSTWTAEWVVPLCVKLQMQCISLSLRRDTSEEFLHHFQFAFLLSDTLHNAFAINPSLFFLLPRLSRVIFMKISLTVSSPLTSPIVLVSRIFPDFVIPNPFFSLFDRNFFVFLL